MSPPRVVWLEDDPDQVVDVARDALLAGTLVVFPTDTVYGLLAWPGSEEAYRRIYRLKGREFSKPLPVLAGWGSALSEAVLQRCLGLSGEQALEIRTDFETGHLTMILSQSSLPIDVGHVQPGSLGARMPRHLELQQLLRNTGEMLWATSVNRTGDLPATTADEVLAWVDTLAPDLAALLGLVVLGRTPGSGQPSRVVDLSSDEPQFLR